MEGYVVTVDVTPNEPTPSDDDRVRDAVDDFLDSLHDLHGSVAADATGWSATVTVDAPTLEAASRAAVRDVVDRAGKAGLPTDPIVRVEVVREDIRDAELERPTMPDLVSGPEAAEMLAVSRQRLHQLAANHPDFPAPAYRLGVGMLWHRSAIERFASEWERRPGRPPAKAAPELACAS